MSNPERDAATTEKLEAAAFRALVTHLQNRTDVQNIDLMNLAGFCRNCLARWYREAAESLGLQMSAPEAKAVIYGMPYSEWQQKYQTQASPEAVQKFQDAAGH